MLYNAISAVFGINHMRFYVEILRSFDTYFSCGVICLRQLLYSHTPLYHTSLNVLQETVAGLTSKTQVGHFHVTIHPVLSAFLVSFGKSDGECEEEGRKVEKDINVCFRVMPSF